MLNKEHTVNTYFEHNMGKIMVKARHPLPSLRIIFSESSTYFCLCPRSSITKKEPPEIGTEDVRFIQNSESREHIARGNKPNSLRDKKVGS